MSDRYYLEDQYEIEGRFVFIQFLEKEIQTEEERTIFSSYKELCQRIFSERMQSSMLKRQLNEYISRSSVMVDYTRSELEKATTSLNTLELKALTLEKNEVIQKLYDRAFTTAVSAHKDDLVKLTYVFGCNLGLSVCDNAFVKGIFY